MRVSDYIVKFLAEHEIRHVFLLSGGGSIYLDDALACNADMSFTGVRNEAAAPMMAEAYARITGKPGAVFVTTGPGGTNALTGVAEAWVDSTPVIVISGQVERCYASRLSKVKHLRSYGTQELDIIKMAEPITKYADIVENEQDIRYQLEKAYHCATTGRPGPVWLDVPLDVQSAEIEEVGLRGYTSDDTVPINAEGIPTEELLCALGKSRRPLLIIGQGVRLSGAIDVLFRYLESYPMPVVSSRLGQDILSYYHRCYVGHGGTQGTEATLYAMRNADFVLSIGSSLSPSFTGGRNAFDPDAVVAAVDIDSAELEKNADILKYKICADAGGFLDAAEHSLDEYITEESRKEWGKWLDICKEKSRKRSFITPATTDGNVNLYYFIDMLDKLADEKCVFVSDAGSSYYSTGQALSFYRAKREITSGTFASMGLTIPLSIGAAVADRSLTILAITGDGSIESNIQELHTMSEENVNVKLFVINNGGYLSIRNTQDKKFDGRYVNSDQNVNGGILDFKKTADCFEMKYYSIKKVEEIEEVYREVTKYRGPALIEVLCDSCHKIFQCY